MGRHFSYHGAQRAILVVVRVRMRREFNRVFSFYIRNARADSNDTLAETGILGRTSVPTAPHRSAARVGLPFLESALPRLANVRPRSWTEFGRTAEQSTRTRQMHQVS